MPSRIPVVLVLVLILCAGKAWGQFNAHELGLYEIPKDVKRPRELYVVHKRVGPDEPLNCQLTEYQRFDRRGRLVEYYQWDENGRSWGGGVKRKLPDGSYEVAEYYDDGSTPEEDSEEDGRNDVVDPTVYEPDTALCAGPPKGFSVVKAFSHLREHTATLDGPGRETYRVYLWPSGAVRKAIRAQSLYQPERLGQVRQFFWPDGSVKLDSVFEQTKKGWRILEVTQYYGPGQDLCVTEFRNGKVLHQDSLWTKGGYRSSKRINWGASYGTSVSRNDTGAHPRDSQAWSVLPNGYARSLFSTLSRDSGRFRIERNVAFTTDVDTGAKIAPIPRQYERPVLLPKARQITHTYTLTITDTALGLVRYQRETTRGVLYYKGVQKQDSTWRAEQHGWVPLHGLSGDAKHFDIRYPHPDTVISVRVRTDTTWPDPKTPGLYQYRQYAKGIMLKTGTRQWGPHHHLSKTYDVRDGKHTLIEMDSTVRYANDTIRLQRRVGQALSQDFHTQVLKDSTGRVLEERDLLQEKVRRYRYGAAPAGGQMLKAIEQRYIPPQPGDVQETDLYYLTAWPEPGKK